MAAGCPECGWASLGPEVCPRCGLPRRFAEAPVGPPLGARLAEGAEAARAGLGVLLGAGRSRLAALTGRLPGPRRVVGGVVMVALVGLAWTRGPEAWERARPHLEAAGAAAREGYQEWSRGPPEVEAAGHVLTLEVKLPKAVTTTRAKIRLVPQGGEAETREFERVANGRYRVVLPVARDRERPVAVGVGFEAGKTRRYRWRCAPGEVGEDLVVDVVAARAGEGCWEELGE